MGAALGGSSLPSLVHNTVATPPQAASGLGMGTDAHQAIRRQSRSTHQHQPSPTHTPPPTRPSPHIPAPLVAATKNPVGNSPVPHDVPETFTPLGPSDSEIAKTIILPNTWYRRLVYRNPISWIPSRKAQFFRERRERQRKSDPGTSYWLKLNFGSSVKRVLGADAEAGEWLVTPGSKDVNCPARKESIGEEKVSTVELSCHLHNSVLNTRSQYLS
ncbi:hypothetical protein Pmani_012033 [Petrolisthes manimaculis]|uniref:Uncharacterized protein n=1 Tax=Petrolisthes manimaculis TaxID=1843537 RepID=A0AAE1Q1P6_9EUCA|nr:hypothetical protein Pmani_012033 [Petrolisthes manimaculis]